VSLLVSCSHLVGGRHGRHRQFQGRQHPRWGRLRPSHPSHRRRVAPSGLERSAAAAARHRALAIRFFVYQLVRCVRTSRLVSCLYLVGGRQARSTSARSSTSSLGSTATESSSSGGAKRPRKVNRRRPRRAASCTRDSFHVVRSSASLKVSAGLMSTFQVGGGQTCSTADSTPLLALSPASSLGSTATSSSSGGGKRPRQVREQSPPLPKPPPRARTRQK
jgi:hypothetical protein